MTRSEQTIRVIRDVIAALNAHDLTRFHALLTTDVLMPDTSGTGSTLVGPDAVVAAVRVMADAFPDLRVTVIDTFADGERGVVEVVRVGTHTGPLRLPSGVVPPTGRPLCLPECITFQVRGAQVALMRAYTDPLSAMAQLGLLPK